MAVHFPVAVVPLMSFQIVTSRGMTAAIQILVSPTNPQDRFAIDVTWHGRETEQDRAECRRAITELFEQAFGGGPEDVLEKDAMNKEEASYNMGYFLQTGKAPDGWNS